MKTITLSKEAVNAYKELMTNPQKHGLEIPSLEDCFEETDIATPKHILFADYIKRIDKPLPKVFFYIIMDELYVNKIAKAPNGDFGYKLKLKPLTPPKND